MQSPPFLTWLWSIFSLNHGEGQDKQDALFFVPLEHQIAPMLLSDAPGDGESQSCTSAFGRKERLEDLRNGILWDRQTLIFYRYADSLFESSYFHGDVAEARRCVDRIEQQIQECLLKLPFIAIESTVAIR